VTRNKLSFSILLITVLILPLFLFAIKQNLDNRSSAAAADELETENGILANGAVSKQDSSASGGSYVELESIQTGTTFYISPTGSDTNSGTQSSPWKTIQKAANTLKSGETALLLDGTYEEAGIEFKTNSGLKEAPITIKAQNKHKAILASRSGCGPSVSISKSYITIDGIRFKMSPNNPACASPNSSTVYIRCWQSTVPTPTNQSTGAEGCTLRNALLDQDASRYEAFKTNQDFSLVENSELPDIAAFNNKGTIFRKNTVKPYPGRYSIAVIGKGGVRDFQAYNNIVYMGSSHEGIVLGGNSCCIYDSSGYEAFNSVAYNNVVIKTDGGASAALTMYGAKDSSFFNNIVIGGFINLVKSGGDGNPQAPHNPTFKNNIIDCRGANAKAGVTPTGTLTIDYNNFYNCTGIPIQTHTISGNPNFVNPASDWHLQSDSPAIGAGIPTSQAAYSGETIPTNKNFEGITRAVPWNLGIY
jgi:hypothetical protein